MFELIGCIIACALLVIGFKIFEKLGVSSFQAIVINYGVAGLIGFIYEWPASSSVPAHFNEAWFINAAVLGLVFIINLYIMGQSTQKIGASVTSVASKMSLVITVMFGILYFNEAAGPLKIIGIVLAVSSVFLIIQVNTKEINRKFIFLPLILFLGGGFIDISLNYNQQVNIKEGESGLFSMVTFSSAFVIGLILLIYKLITGTEKINLKSTGCGIILGIVNWFSIFLLLLTLKNKMWDSSTAYTIINIGILLVVVVCGVFIFKEKLNNKQWIGILLALAAIALISLA